MFLLGISILLQIITGIFLGLHYTSDINSAYFSLFFLIEKYIMDGVYVIFILTVYHLSFFLYFFILEELYLMLHIFVIQMLGFLEILFASS